MSAEEMRTVGWGWGQGKGCKDPEALKGGVHSQEVLFLYGVSYAVSDGLCNISEPPSLSIKWATASLLLHCAHCAQAARPHEGGLSHSHLIWRCFLSGTMRVNTISSIESRITQETNLSEYV